jgi:hypothetical protein
MDRGNKDVFESYLFPEDLVRVEYKWIKERNGLPWDHHRSDTLAPLDAMIERGNPDGASLAKRPTDAITEIYD